MIYMYFVLANGLYANLPASAPGMKAHRNINGINCHATCSVTGAIALSVVRSIGGTVANRLAQVPQGHAGRVSQHTGEFVVGEASLLRTCRQLFEGQIYIPAPVWNGAEKERNAAEIYAGFRDAPVLSL